VKDKKCQPIRLAFLFLFYIFHINYSKNAGLFKLTTEIVCLFSKY